MNQRRARDSRMALSLMPARLGQCTAPSSKPWLDCSDVTSSMKHPILMGPVTPYIDQRSVSSSAAAALTMMLGRGQGWYGAAQNPGAVPAGEVDQTLERVSLEQKPVPDWAKGWPSQIGRAIRYSYSPRVETRCVRDHDGQGCDEADLVFRPGPGYFDLCWWGLAGPCASAHYVLWHRYMDRGLSLDEAIKREDSFGRELAWYDDGTILYMHARQK